MAPACIISEISKLYWPKFTLFISRIFSMVLENYNDEVTIMSSEKCLMIQSTQYQQVLNQHADGHKDLL